MNFEEAIKVIEYEASEGIAYTSRVGTYPSKAEVKQLLLALEVIHDNLKGEALISRNLAASLFIINDQIQGNYDGALAQGIEISSDFDDEDVAQINELLYAIFEDH